MIKRDTFYLLGIDGGASNTRGVIFTQEGQTLANIIIDEGSNLTINPNLSSEIIIKMIHELCKKSKINIDALDSIGLGLAGSSNQIGRDMLFGKLDNINLSKKTIIMNDAEAAYEISCPGDIGILVTVGTGIICLSRKDGAIYRSAGKGHDEGDLGSGFWIGKQAILNLTLNETSVLGDSDLEEIMSLFLYRMNESIFQVALENLYKHENNIKIIASLAKDIILLAEKGNEISISIIQEASLLVSEYIINLLDKINYNKNNLVLAGNGSIIKNDFFRQSLNDELRFHYPELKWTFSQISPAYGAAIITSKIYDIKVDISAIIKGGNFVPA